MYAKFFLFVSLQKISHFSFLLFQARGSIIWLTAVHAEEQQKIWKMFFLYYFRCCNVAGCANFNDAAPDGVQPARKYSLFRLKRKLSNFTIKSILTVIKG